MQSVVTSRRQMEERVSGMGTNILASPHVKPNGWLAKTVAAVAIAAFWCISAVGTTVGTAVGVTSLAAAVTAATSTTAEAGRRRRRRRRRRRSRRWWRGQWVPWWAYEYY